GSGNWSWPALYFIDARGRVRQHHFGEGEYQRPESAIQQLLAETGVGGLRDGDAVSVDAQGIEAAADWDNLKSPETYVGYDRAQNFASGGGAELERRRVYAAPARLALNQWALAGEWTMGRQATVPVSPKGVVSSRVPSRDLHLVMGPPRQGVAVRFRMTIDGQPPGSARGSDVEEGAPAPDVD